MLVAACALLGSSWSLYWLLVLFLLSFYSGKEAMGLKNPLKTFTGNQKDQTSLDMHQWLRAADKDKDSNLNGKKRACQWPC